VVRPFKKVFQGRDKRLSTEKERGPKIKKGLQNLSTTTRFCPRMMSAVAARSVFSSGQGINEWQIDQKKTYKRKCAQGKSG